MKPDTAFLGLAANNHMLLWRIWAFRDVVFDTCLLLHSCIISWSWRNFYPTPVFCGNNVLAGKNNSTFTSQQHKVWNCPDGCNGHSRQLRQTVIADTVWKSIKAVINCDYFVSYRIWLHHNVERRRIAFLPTSPSYWWNSIFSSFVMRTWYVTASLLLSWVALCIHLFLSLLTWNVCCRI